MVEGIEVQVQPNVQVNRCCPSFSGKEIAFMIECVHVVYCNFSVEEILYPVA